LINSKKNSRPINCLINNAGLRFRKKFLKVNKLEIQKIFDVNFFSIFLIMQIFSKFVIKNKLSNPSIINISSIVGITGFDELSVYASSKNALSALTKSYAVEMSKFGIRANTVSPGFTKTSYYKKFKKNKKLYNWTLSRIPQKRWGESQEIAELICFVLSEKSKYLNGENISIDGGWTNA
jgi:NAD(P)-dependent dehydrogenase (short-subunit alcohol dehydrogenase family)